MIERIKDEGKFICNVISVTGKLLKQVEFNSFEKACRYREEMLKKNTIEDVEIYTPNNTAIACEDKDIKDADTCKVLYFKKDGSFEHEVEKDMDVANREFLANQKLCTKQEYDKNLYVGYKKYAKTEGGDFLMEVGIYRFGYPVDDVEAYITDLGRDGSEYENVVFKKKVEDSTNDTEDIKIEDQPEERVCCICGNPIKDWGNNPNPICKNGECCDECNQKYVLQARVVKSYRPHQKLVFINCDNCKKPVILANFENTCECGKKYDLQGNEIVEVKNNNDTKVLAKTNKMNDAREYIGEYVDMFYERYRGVNVYKKQNNNIEYEFTAQFLDKDLKGKACEEIEEKIDKAIEAYVNSYAKDFEKKELK